MDTALRRDVFQACQTVIVKVGSNVLAGEDDHLNVARIQALSAQISRIRQTGRRVVLVSSGAVAAGLKALRLNRTPDSLPELQAAAAAGQPGLMTAWSEAFQRFDIGVAQILLTINDFRSRHRYLNVRNTLRTLLAHDLLPIVNENDSVSIEEIALGDNDQLAAMLATLVPDPLLVILSAVDGLLVYNEGDADSPPNVLSVVNEPTDDLLKHVSGVRSSRGRGGMRSKLTAILKATGMGESVVLANGCRPDVLDDVREGRDTGTLFLASGISVPAWKKWIGYASGVEGRLLIDAGAGQAVARAGKSLLAVGIVSVDGQFSQGATVELVTPDGSTIGRGLVNYSSADLNRLVGCHSSQIPEVLGHVPYQEVVHRDNLVLTAPPA